MPAGKRIAKEEIFDPVLATFTFKTVDEAIKLANDSIYGLYAAVWTSNITATDELADHLASASCFSVKV